MANRCLFREEYPAGYNYAMETLREDQICERCPSFKDECPRSPHLQSGIGRQKNRFFLALARMIGCTIEELQELSLMFEYEEKQSAYVSSSKRKHTKKEKASQDNS